MDTHSLTQYTQSLPEMRAHGPSATNGYSLQIENEQWAPMHYFPTQQRGGFLISGRYPTHSLHLKSRHRLTCPQPECAPVLSINLGQTTQPDRSPGCSSPSILQSPEYRSDNLPLCNTSSIEKGKTFREWEIRKSD
jgi:hypothetical protein